MIERKFIAQNFKEFQIKEYVKKSLSRVGLSSVKLQRTSVGERVVVVASRPGLVVGRGGSTIQKLTRELKEEFGLENPQIEIEEIKDFNLDATVVAESVVNQLERFGTQRFKGVGHKTVEAIMRSKALGVEILISGKIPSSRAKTWRFADGYMKKCGDLAITGVDTAIDFASLKTGVVGVQVRIMPATTKLPDQISFDKREREAAASAPVVEEVKDEALENEVAKKEEAEKKSTKKSTKTSKKTSTKSTKKAAKKAEEKSEEKTEKEADKKAEDKSEKKSEAKADEKSKEKVEKKSEEKKAESTEGEK
jgi:small subunit ribosomal protein S3